MHKSNRVKAIPNGDKSSQNKARKGATGRQAKRESQSESESERERGERERRINDLLIKLSSLRLGASVQELVCGREGRIRTLPTHQLETDK